jgi:glyoxylase-like metal-dependent hydrolase (beta-lactamase superfamily II)
VTIIRGVLAPNPGPFTLEGTNTWLVGPSPCIVIDPGPDLAEHVDRVLDEAGEVRAILVTHHHLDHAAAAPRLAERTGAPVLSASADGDRRLSHGDHVEGADGVRVHVVGTPGHTADHLAFWIPEGRALFTGDAVLGRGTSVIDPPEGSLAAYLASLERMIEVRPSTIHPGHGPEVDDAVAKLDEYLAHRSMREGQIVAALERGPRTPEHLVVEIYGEYPDELHAAAARSVLAHLVKVEEEGRVGRVGGGDRFALSIP